MKTRSSRASPWPPRGARARRSLPASARRRPPADDARGGACCAASAAALGVAALAAPAHAAPARERAGGRRAGHRGVLAGLHDGSYAAVRRRGPAQRRRAATTAATPGTATRAGWCSTTAASAPATPRSTAVPQPLRALAAGHGGGSVVVRGRPRRRRQALRRTERHPAGQPALRAVDRRGDAPARAQRRPVGAHHDRHPLERLPRGARPASGVRGHRRDRGRARRRSPRPRPRSTARPPPRCCAGRSATCTTRRSRTARGRRFRSSWSTTTPICPSPSTAKGRSTSCSTPAGRTCSTPTRQGARHRGDRPDQRQRRRGEHRGVPVRDGRRAGRRRRDAAPAELPARAGARRFRRLGQQAGRRADRLRGAGALRDDVRLRRRPHRADRAGRRRRLRGTTIPFVFNATQPMVACTIARRARRVYHRHRQPRQRERARAVHRGAPRGRPAERDRRRRQRLRRRRRVDGPARPHDLGLGGSPSPTSSPTSAPRRQGAFADPFVAGNIGAGVWKRFAVTFDYPHQTMALVPGRPSRPATATSARARSSSARPARSWSPTCGPGPRPPKPAWPRRRDRDGRRHRGQRGRGGARAVPGRAGDGDPAGRRRKDGTVRTVA